MRSFTITLFLGWAGWAQAPPSPCLPTPPVAAAFQKLEDLRQTLPIDLYIDQTRAWLRQLVLEHPDDVFAHLRYLAAHREKGFEDIVRQYRAARDAHPEDARAELYFAASLIGSDTPEAIRRLKALTAQPNFPYPHWILGEVFTYEKFVDRTAAAAHLSDFVEACPEYLPVYERFSFFASGEPLRRAAERLRRVLNGRTDREALGAFRWLWAMEFRAKPEAQESLRIQVQEDMARLGDRYAADDPAAQETRRVFSRLTGGPSGAGPMPPKRPGEEVFESLAEWEKQHPPPQNAGAEARETYQRGRLEAAQELRKRWPDEPMPQLIRLQALAELAETSEAELAAGGDELIQVNRKRPRRFLSTPAVILVARVYLKRGMRLAEIPAMLEAGRREADRNKMFPEADFMNDRNQRMNEQNRYQSRIEARSLEFDWAGRRQDAVRAQEALAAMREDVDRLRGVTLMEAYAQHLDAEYWTKMAQLAEREGRGEGSALYRRTAEERRNAPRRLARVGGEAVSAAGKALPPFRLRGLDGREWTQEDLKGKVAVINVWATWCAPCVAELPHLEKVHARLRGDAKVVVLSFNIDANPGVVAPFLKAKDLSFPVLLAQEYIDQVLTQISIPRTWVVTGSTIRDEVGFRANFEEWIRETMAKVDEAKGQL